MVMGQDECDILYYLPNSGTNESPIFTEFSTTLPGLGALPSFPIFHVANLYKGDLFISLNASNRAQEFNIDFSRSLIRYAREEAGWQSPPSDFLQDKMIDLGENARPFFTGNSNQGELLVTSNQNINGTVTGAVTKFNLDQNGLNLIDEDYLNLSSLGLTDLQVQQFGNHFFYSGTRLENFVLLRSLFYIQGNKNLQNAQPISIPDVALRGNDHLEFFSYENLTYLLLARQTGELIRYRVDFGPDPTFILMDRNYLGFTDNPATRNLTVHVVQEPSSQTLDLYAADQRGRIMVIPDFMSNTELTDDLLEINNARIRTKLGRNAWVSSIPDIFAGKSDLIVGTAAGGLIYLNQNTGITPGEDIRWQVKLYPNPTEDFLTIISTEEATGQLINSLGQVLLDSFALPAHEASRINLLPYARGVYYLRLTNANGENIGKKVIKK